MNIQDTDKRIVHTDVYHDSAHKHVTGAATYIDDLPVPAGTLHAALGLGRAAHARIRAIDLKAVREAPGVVGVLAAQDIPGTNDVSPTGRNDDPVFAEDRVMFCGQPVFAVIARTRIQARRAATLAAIEYEELPATITLEQAMAAKGPLVTEPLTLARGDVEDALANAPHRLQGEFSLGGQDHFYLEGQIALAIPGEDDEVMVYASTQHPSEVQHMVARVLGVASHAVTVSVRRMGGGFGGKETQPGLFACIAALAARKYRCAVKLRPDRDEDMIATGKRHDFHITYDVGFDDEGRILAVDGAFAARCGFSADLSGPVTDRALFHADNAYYYPHVRLRSQPFLTHTVSNTAFRGFGGPQGVVAAERIIEEIAAHLQRDPLDIRKANFYGTTDRNITPYHQTVHDNILGKLVDALETRSDYRTRRQAIIAFNNQNRGIVRGIALTPVKFGISFTATWYNQAGSLVHVYNDGSIHLNHGGTEMGQGLFTKVAQVVADCFQVDLERVKPSATTTAKVPNTSATAASSGTDLNGMAAYNACEQIKARLVRFAMDTYGVTREQVRFIANQVMLDDRLVPFDQFIRAAYMARVHLSAAGFYKTPDIHWDRNTGRGRPFYYFAYGAAVSEVSVDPLSGEYHLERVDILHDVGRSLNPAIDRGQIEGGFIQGVGWLTTEELWWDKTGRLRTHAPSTYKIPLASDRPGVLNIDLASWSVNTEPVIHRSKAVGEPPLMLGVSVFEALSMAVAAAAGTHRCPCLDAPATPERILLAIERLRAQDTRVHV